MKILYLSACSQIGGAERALLDMLASIRAADPKLSLQVLTTEPGFLVSECRALGIEANVQKLPQHVARLGDAAARRRSFAKLAVAIPAIIVYLLRLRRAIRAIAPDVIHTNGFKMHVLAALAKPRRTPLVWHLHDYVSSRPVMAVVLRRLARFCSVAIANSESVAADARKTFAQAIEIRTIHNAVDLNRFSPTGTVLDLDDLSGMRPTVPDPVKVGLVATFARWKGHETFLRAIALLPRELALRAYIIGDAIYQTESSQHSVDELRRLAQQLGVADRVGFTGFVPDSAAAIRALDIVVHASIEREPFGLVIAEAAACGKTIVASRQAGATELMSDGADFLSHDVGDHVSLALRLTGLAGAGYFRRKLGESARTTAEQIFDRARLAASLIPLYRNLVAKPVGETAKAEIGELCPLTSDL